MWRGETLQAVRSVGRLSWPLTLWSGRRDGNNVTLEIEDLHKGLFKAVPPQFEDLLEIAAYVEPRGPGDIAGRKGR